jgi:hypothetical protein
VVGGLLGCLVPWFVLKSVDTVGCYSPLRYVVISATSVVSSHPFAGETRQKVPARQNSVSHWIKRWYQPLWYITSMMVLVRYSLTMPRKAFLAHVHAQQNLSYTRWMDVSPRFRETEDCEIEELPAAVRYADTGWFTAVPFRHIQIPRHFGNPIGFMTCRFDKACETSRTIV